MTPGEVTEGWYLLIHQIPATPLYLRAKIRRLLVRSGAVALKKSVYALPRLEGALERLEKVAAEIRRHGGEAYVCEARFTDPQDHALLLDSHRNQRTADYQELAGAARAQFETLRALSATPAVQKQLAQLRRRLEWIKSVDLLDAAGREGAEKSVRGLERALVGRVRKKSIETPWVGRTWVTRRGVHVDRMACAWFVRRFLDRHARFRFVGPRQVGPRAAEVGFDMPDVEFTHEGDRCSFESLLRRTGLQDPALERIAGIVHDLDLKDGKFGYEETPGIERLLAGIVAAHSQDKERLERGAMLFEDLYRSLDPKPHVSAPQGIKALSPPSSPRRGKP